MAKIMWGTPIFNFQDIEVRKNHECIRANSAHQIEYIEVIGTSTAHAKQMMYEAFLKSDCEYFFGVDADIWFFENDFNPVDILIGQDKDIIGGIYTFKRPPCMPVYRPLDLAEYKELRGKFPEDYKFEIPNDTFEVRYLGGGCMMMKREVIEKLCKVIKAPNLQFFKDGEFLSEDYAFCERARNLGYKMYACPLIKLGHMGKYVYTLEDYK